MSNSNSDAEGPSSLYAMYDVLKELCLNNADHFKNDDSVSGRKLEACFKTLHDNIESIFPLVDEIRKAAPSYDFDSDTPGNGYRSFITVVDAFIVYGVKICRQISINRGSYFFRKGAYLREVDTCSQVIASLKTLLTLLKILISWSEPGQLYPKDEHTPDELLAQADQVNQFCFYGSCLGFQFCESMQVILKGLAILMVSFSEVYYSDGGVLERATNSIWHSSKYVLNPDLRAQRIVNISQYASVDFCKKFWFLGELELMQRLPNFVNPSVSVNRLISIPPEPLFINRNDGTLLEIPIPSAHTGPSPLTVRLISGSKRVGMVGEASGKESLLPATNGLIFHCHGGGFVAQSSRSHETYLRQWAQSLPASLLSVDYSLAPEAPFPRALEDTLYAYCWALNNAALLGTTCERIVFAGDSAGANLCICLAMKCIEMGLRLPDGIFLAYVPVVVSFIPSPARLLCLMDPLLPFGFLMGCLKAYACSPEAYTSSTTHEQKLRRSKIKKRARQDSTASDESFEEISASELLELEGLLTASQKANLASNGTDSEEKISDQNTNQNNEMDNSTSCVMGSKYVLDSEKDEHGKEVPVLKESSNNNKDEHVLFEVPQDVLDPGLPARITRAAANIATAIRGTLTSLTSPKSSIDESSYDEGSPNEDDPLLENLMSPCPMDLLKFEVPHDPYLSPYWAEDRVLSQFPPTTIVSLQLDPCLDDCVEFAKKLKRLGNTVKLEILDGLPHGFLNFAMLSKEANEGSKLCMKRIAELLNMEEVS